MVTVEGVKFNVGSTVTYDVPDASSYYGESTIWHNRAASNEVELWFLGATFEFTRTGSYNGTYTLQGGSTANALEVFDEAFSYQSSSRFVLTAAADPFPPGLPPTNNYNYIPILSDTGQNLTFHDFSCVSGDNDVFYFNITFDEMPEANITFSVNLYYQHN